MRRIISSTLAVGTVAACITLWVARDPETEAPPARPEASAEKLDAPPRELEGLRRRLRALEEEQSHLGEQLAAARAAVQAPGPPPTSSEPLHEKPVEQISADARAALEVDRRVEALETQLAVESPDPEWTPGAEAELRALTNAMSIPGAALRDATCGRSLCRLTVAIGPETPGMELARGLLDGVSWPAPRFIRVDGDTTHTATAYFAREGHRLPTPSL